MIRIAHLLDDFAMGGVTRALSLFTDEPRMTQVSRSFTVPMRRRACDSPSLDADLILIHVPPCWSRLPYLAALRLRNQGARIVQVEHSYTRGFERHRVKSQRRFRYLLRCAAFLVDEVVAVSHAQSAWLVEAGVPRTKVTTIHPWSGRFDLYDLGPRSARKEAIRLLAYGRFSIEKNFIALLEAMRMVPGDEARLTLFGTGPEEEAVRALARELPHVTVQPAFPDPSPHLARCDAVVIPSRHEAFGLVATEARMAGRPILVADVDGLPEQARAGGGVVANMETPADIANAIRDLAGLDLARLGIAAREGVLSQHDRIVSLWLACLRRAGSRNVLHADATARPSGHLG